MTTTNAISLGLQAIEVVVEIGGPLLIASLGIGLVVSIFQAATQIQEQTLTLIPKLAGVIALIVTLGPWMLDRLVGYASNLYISIPTLVR